MEARRKCDPELGQLVSEHLVSLGLETPMKFEKIMIVKQQLNLSKEI